MSILDFDLDDVEEVPSSTLDFDLDLVEEVPDDGRRDVTFGNAFSGLSKLRDPGSGWGSVPSRLLDAGGIPGQVASTIYDAARNWGDLNPDEKASTKGLTVPLAGAALLAPVITAGTASTAAGIAGATAAQAALGGAIRTAGNYFANPEEGLADAAYEGTVGSPGSMALDVAFGPIGSGLSKNVGGAGAEAFNLASKGGGPREALKMLREAARRPLRVTRRTPDSGLTGRVPASNLSPEADIPQQGPGATLLDRQRELRKNVDAIPDDIRPKDANGKPIVAVEDVRKPMSRSDSIFEYLTQKDAAGNPVGTPPSEYAQRARDYIRGMRSPIHAFEKAAVGGDARRVPQTEADVYANLFELTQNGISIRNRAHGDLSAITAKIAKKFEEAGHIDLLKAPPHNKWYSTLGGKDAGPPQPSPVFHYLSGEKINGVTAAEVGAELPIEVKTWLDNGIFKPIWDYGFAANRLAGAKQTMSLSQLMNLVKDDPGIIGRNVGKYGESQLPIGLTADKLERLDALARMATEGSKATPGVPDDEALAAFDALIETIPGMTRHLDNYTGPLRVDLPVLYRENYIPLLSKGSAESKETILANANALLPLSKQRTPAQIYDAASAQRIPGRTGRARQASPEAGLDPERFDMDMMNIIDQYPRRESAKVANLSTFGPLDKSLPVMDIPGMGASKAPVNVGQTADKIFKSLSESPERTIYGRLLSDQAARRNSGALLDNNRWGLDTLRGATSRTLLTKSFLTSQQESAKLSWASGSAAKEGGRLWRINNRELSDRLAESANAGQSPKLDLLTTDAYKARSGDRVPKSDGGVGGVTDWVNDPLALMGRVEVANRTGLVDVNAYYMGDLATRLAIRKANGMKPNAAELYEAKAMFGGTDDGAVAARRILDSWEAGNGSFGYEMYAEGIGNLQRHQMYGLDLETMPADAMTSGGKLLTQFKPYAFKAQQQFFRDIVNPAFIEGPRIKRLTGDDSLQKLGLQRLRDMVPPTAAASLRKTIYGSILGFKIFDYLYDDDTSAGDIADDIGMKWVQNASQVLGLAPEAAGVMLDYFMEGDLNSAASAVTPPAVSLLGQVAEEGMGVLGGVVDPFENPYAFGSDAAGFAGNFGAAVLHKPGLKIPATAAQKLLDRWARKKREKDAAKARTSTPWRNP